MIKICALSCNLFETTLLNIYKALKFLVASKYISILKN